MFIFSAFLDLIEALILASLQLVLFPLASLRHASFGGAVRHLRFLLPYGQLATVVRAQLDGLLRRYDGVGLRLESTLALLEEAMLDKSGELSSDQVMVMSELYGRLTQNYLICGQIEDAALVVIRASRSLGVERLYGLIDFDVRTAQIVRAGISAGRLLEETGNSRPGKTHNNQSSFLPQQRLKRRLQRRAHIGGAHKQSRSRSIDSQAMAQVIPFPPRK